MSMRKISSEATILNGVTIYLDVWRDPEGRQEDCAVVGTTIADDAPVGLDDGPVTRACPLPQVAAEAVSKKHGYQVASISYVPDIPDGVTMPDGATRARCWKVRDDVGGTDGDDTKDFSADGLRASIARFALAYNERLAWIAARKASLDV